MSILSRFIGAPAPKNIVNFCSSGGVNIAVPNPISGTSSGSTSVKRILSGALTANVLSTVLSITGSGVVAILGVGSEDATSRTIRLKVTIDGTVVFDATSDAIAAINLGLMAIGARIQNTTFALEEVRFYTSLLVEVASSLTETDKISLRTQYRTN